MPRKHINIFAIIVVKSMKLVLQFIISWFQANQNILIVLLNVKVMLNAKVKLLNVKIATNHFIEDNSILIDKITIFVALIVNLSININNHLKLESVKYAEEILKLKRYQNRNSALIVVRMNGKKIKLENQTLILKTHIRIANIEEIFIILLHIN